MAMLMRVGAEGAVPMDEHTLRTLFSGCVGCPMVKDKLITGASTTALLGCDLQGTISARAASECDVKPANF